MPAAALPPPQNYLPFEDGPFRMAMALQAIGEDAWIELDADYPAHLAERRRLLEVQRDEVLAGLPGSEAMCVELLEMLADALVRHHPQWFSRTGRRLRNALLGEEWALDPPDAPPRPAGAGGFLPAAPGSRGAASGRRRAVLSQPLAAVREARPPAGADPRAGAVLRRAAGTAGRPVHGQSAARAGGDAAELVDHG
jgi:hypothetical protein